MALTAQQTTRALDKTLRALVPTQLQIPAQDRAELRQAALYEWAATEGLRRGQAQATPERIVPLVSASYLEGAVRPYMRTALEQMGALQDFRTRARFDDPDVQRAMEEGVAPEAAGPEADRELPLLDEMDPTRAALVCIHLGQYVIPGQPKAWLNRQKFDRALGEEVTIYGPAFKDFVIYHSRSATRKGQPCPTCKKISRFFRVPGVGQPQVQQVMDQYVLMGQAQFGG